LTAWLNSKRRDFQVPGENLEGCLLAWSGSSFLYSRIGRLNNAQRKLSWQ
jgi:hypothetical protein